MGFAHGRPATIVRAKPGGLDQYGDPVDDGEPHEIVLASCSWSPRTQGVGPSSSEIHDRGREGVIVGLTLYVRQESLDGADWPPQIPAGEQTLRETDQLRLDGVTYDVEGEPGDWWNPHTGRRLGIEAALRKATG